MNIKNDDDQIVVKNMQFVERKIFTVTQLNQKTRILLEKNIPIIWVSGEISNLSQPSSLGHVYFSLKDSGAQIKCAFFRQYGNKCNVQIKNGTQVVVQGQISLYEARGDYQLIAYDIEQAGIGILHKKLQQLKDKLQKEGLFDIQHKKILPKIPNCIGVITSPSGAAIKDILTILQRRFPTVPIILYPTQVQGTDAAAQIVQALEIANLRQDCDILILTRGGGSIEDLWSFNEEIVARAIFISKIPIISAVGHEVDFTIADFVADVRAPTPSAAAELAVPNIIEELYSITILFKRILNLINGKLQNASLILQALRNRLVDPRQHLQQNSQHLDDLEQRLKYTTKHLYLNKSKYLELIITKLLYCSPLQHIHKFMSITCSLEKNLNLAIQNQLAGKLQKLNVLSNNLNAISPLATLNRGYSIVTKNDRLINSQIIKCNDIIEVMLSQAKLICTVNQVNIIKIDQ